ncbi:MAG: Crp/Fnr family transcriptional regulator [Inquilinus sp.]|uniref:Crp/Fnr family transcriptional regulator n=1 Tax=Inquilinus sp. TaxID=1932117 RepID=UPI003F2E6144
MNEHAEAVVRRLGLGLLAGNNMIGLEEALLLKIGRYFTPSPSEVLALRELLATREQYALRLEIMNDSDKQFRVLALGAGWGYSFKDLPNGLRQIIDFLLPGDLFGLGGIFVNGSGFSFATITPVEVASISPQALFAVSRQWPRLGGALLWSSSLESSIMGERLVAIGRRSAAARVAHLLLELSVRLEFIGQGSSSRFFCPLAQHDLANALGLTAIHVNRVLRNLRQLGLVVFRNSEVEFLDRAGLVELADFDAAYLGLGRASSRKIFRS